MFELTRQQQELIHTEILGILKDVGLRVENLKVLDALAGIGARIEKQSMRARFDPDLVEGFLSRCPKVDWQKRRPSLDVRASFYAGKYHDPETGELIPIDEHHFREYFRLAKALPNVKSYFTTGCQWPVKPEAEPLWERFNAWKYGLMNAATLYPIETSENILELCQTYAELKGLPLKQVAGGGVYLMSPLRLSKEEAAQFVWWWEKGFHVGIANMTTAGLSAPVTLPGQVALSLAESIALALLRKACYGGEGFAIFAMLSTVDMKTMMRPYGRPELAMANRIMASMARFYQVNCFAQSGLSDAKLPSVEAGMQKAMNTVATLLAGAGTILDAGTLAVDQVFSPIQMILDHELAGALVRLIEQPEVNRETIGSAVIREVGPGSTFIATDHTAKHFRKEVWEPKIWSREMLQAWQTAGSHIDTDKALEEYRRIMADAPDPVVLTREEQDALLKVIRRVEAKV